MSGNVGIWVLTGRSTCSMTRCRQCSPAARGLPSHPTARPSALVRRVPFPSARPGPAQPSDSPSDSRSTRPPSSAIAMVAPPTPTFPLLHPCSQSWHRHAAALNEAGFEGGKLKDEKRQFTCSQLAKMNGVRTARSLGWTLKPRRPPCQCPEAGSGPFLESKVFLEYKYQSCKQDIGVASKASAILKEPVPCLPVKAASLPRALCIYASCAPLLRRETRSSCPLSRFRLYTPTQ